MSALIFTGSLWEFVQKELLLQARQAAGALYANLANAVFATIYCKLLISRLGT